MPPVWIVLLHHLMVFLGGGGKRRSRLSRIYDLGPIWVMRRAKQAALFEKIKEICLHFGAL